MEIEGGVGQDNCWGGCEGNLSHVEDTVGGSCIGVVDGLGMRVGDGGGTNKGSVVMNGGRGACLGSGKTAISFMIF